MLQTQQLCVTHCVLRVRHLSELCLLLCKLLLDALLAKWLVFEHHDRLWEVHLTQIHLNCIGEERHSAHAAATLLRASILLAHLRHVRASCCEILTLWRSFLRLVNKLLVVLVWSAHLSTESREVGGIDLLVLGLATRHGHGVLRLLLLLSLVSSVCLILFTARLATITTFRS